MRQPVAAVLSLAAAALAEPGLPRAAQRWLEEIVGQAESVAEVIALSLEPDDPASRTPVRADWPT